jgi:hypothetical protein
VKFGEIRKELGSWVLGSPQLLTGHWTANPKYCRGSSDIRVSNNGIRSPMLQRRINLSEHYFTIYLLGRSTNIPEIFYMYCNSRFIVEKSYLRFLVLPVVLLILYSSFMFNGESEILYLCTYFLYNVYNTGITLLSLVG